MLFFGAVCLCVHFFLLLFVYCRDWITSSTMHVGVHETGWDPSLFSRAVPLAVIGSVWDRHQTHIFELLWAACGHDAALLRRMKGLVEYDLFITFWLLFFSFASRSCEDIVLRGDFTSTNDTKTRQAGTSALRRFTKGLESLAETVGELARFSHRGWDRRRSSLPSTAFIGYPHLVRALLFCLPFSLFRFLELLALFGHAHIVE